MKHNNLESLVYKKILSRQKNLLAASFKLADLPFPSVIFLLFISFVLVQAKRETQADKNWGSGKLNRNNRDILQSDGFWIRNEWHERPVHNSFLQYFKFNKARQIKHRNKLKPFKEHVGILFIGDSLDRNAVAYACKYFNATLHPFLSSEGSVLKYQFCTIPRLNLTLANFVNYGVFDPPYWKFAYVDESTLFPPNVHNHSFSHIEHDTKCFNRINFGKDPDLVVIQSYLWDLSREWLLSGQSLDFEPSSGFVGEWVSRVAKFIDVVQHRFPHGKYVWRTAPFPNPDIGRTLQIIEDMNESIVEYLRKHRKEINICDWSKILLATNSPEKVPRTHPRRIASLAYVNVILNLARRLTFVNRSVDPVVDEHQHCLQ